MQSKLHSKIGWWLLDGLLLLGLLAYAVAGVPLATFHGDEGMYTYATMDYWDVVERGDWRGLMTAPPYFIDSRPHLRLLVGNLPRYVIGASLDVNGYTEADLPIAPGWNWGLSYDDNVAASWLPRQEVLLAARYPSMIFWGISLVMLFALARVIGNRLIAYSTVILYGLNPALLLNARRAIAEAYLSAFGLATVLLAALITRRVLGRKRAHPLLWLLLILSAALTLASKHTGAVYLVGAWGWVGMAAVYAAFRDRQWQPLLRTVVLLAVSTGLVLALWVALSPAMWNNPLNRFGDLIDIRTEILDVQVANTEDAPTTLAQRLQDILTEPFIAPPEHFEVASWGRTPAVVAQIERYHASRLAGLPTGWFLGLPLTLLAALGVGVLLVGWLRKLPHRADATGLLLWFGVVAAGLLANPLPWQRYALPLIPVAALLAGLGLAAVVQWICTQIRTESTLAASGIVEQTDAETL